VIQNVAVKFWLPLRSKHAYLAIRISRRHQWGESSEQLHEEQHLEYSRDRFLLSRNWLSREHTSFWERRRPKTRSFEWDSLCNQLHRFSSTLVESITPPDHPTVRTLWMILILTRAVTDSNRYSSSNQGQNLNHYRRITTCRSCSYWNLQDPHWQLKLLGYIITGRRWDQDSQE